MSLIKKQSMTEENRAAHQRNGRQSRGAATAEGKERSRAANLRHGFYAQGREEALRALGEDPAALAALIEDAHEEWRPANPFQARIAEHLARLWWRMERAERIQQSLAAQLIQQHEKRRRQKALELRERINPTFDALGCLLETLAEPRGYTTPAHFRLFCEAHERKLDEVEEEILRLMHRLRKPSSWGDAPEEATEWDDDDFPIPEPDIPVAEGTEREQVREELRILAQQELELTQEAWNPELEKHEKPLSGIEQDEVQAAPHRHAELMRREEEACFRQFMRLGNFLLKIQNRGEKRAKNEGAPGYVDENTQEAETAPTANCPESGADAPPPPSPQGATGRAEAAPPTNGSAGSEVRNPKSDVRSEIPRPESDVRKERPSEAARQAVGSGGSEVGSGRPPKVSHTAAHGRIPNPRFRIPDQQKPRIQRPMMR
jgi:hypothetical protein